MRDFEKIYSIEIGKENNGPMTKIGAKNSFHTIGGREQWDVYFGKQRPCSWRSA